MIRSKAVTNSSENATGSSRIVPSYAEGIALCTAFILTLVFIVVGNLLTIVLFAVNRKLRRKRSLFLVINMAFADLMVGAVILPIYIYAVGANNKLWTGGWSKSLIIFYMLVDSFFMHASLTSAAFIAVDRFCAIYWPFKHRTLSKGAYRIVSLLVWTLALVIAAVWTTLSHFISTKVALYVTTPCILILTLIICGCNIGMWIKWQHRSIRPSLRRKRDLQNKRLTNTLMFVSILALLSWFPVIIFNYLIYVYTVQIPLKYYHLVNALSYSSSFVNPFVYALRIPEVREALVLCCFGGQTTAQGTKDVKRKCGRTLALTRVTNLTTLGIETSHRQEVFEEEVMDTKL